MAILKRIIDSATKDSKIAGLEVVQQPGEEPLVRCVTLALSRGAVTVLDQWEERGLIKALGRLDRNRALALVLNGRGVLHKQVTWGGTGQAMDDSLLSSVLPALHLADFYVQRYRLEGRGFYSLARRDAVTALHEQIKESGFRVVSLSFGPFVFGEVWPFIKKEIKSWKDVAVSEHRLVMDEDGVTGLQVPDLTGTTNKMKIGEEDLEGAYLLAYAAAFAELAGPSGNLLLQAEPIEVNRAEHHQHRIFKASLAAALVFFFLLLLVNYLAFTSLTERSASLHERLEEEQSSLGRLSRLEEDAAEKRQFLRATGWLGTQRLSFHADRLAATVPNLINLTELDINPLDQKRSKAEDRLAFEAGSIAVRGACRNPMELNNWIKAIRQLSWVERVDRQNYTYEEAKGEGRFSFNIQVKGER